MLSWGKFSAVQDNTGRISYTALHTGACWESPEKIEGAGVLPSFQTWQNDSPEDPGMDV